MNTLTMIIISLVAGLLSTMNFWAIRINDARFHLNDVYMAVLMTSWMILLSSSYSCVFHNAQSHLHYESGDQVPTILVSLACIITSYYFIRQQQFIDDNQFLKGMIPHHSMAILMAKRIKKRTLNPKIKLLANNIIKTQNIEIKLMKALETHTKID